MKAKDYKLGIEKSVNFAIDASANTASAQRAEAFVAHLAGYIRGHDEKLGAKIFSIFGRAIPADEK